MTVNTRKKLKEKKEKRKLVSKCFPWTGLPVIRRAPPLPWRDRVRVFWRPHDFSPEKNVT